jgi:flagellar hook-associated protein 1
MSSITGILSTAARALVTHQKALVVTTHNISNAETEGYSRQRAVLGASAPLVTPHGVMGTGVNITGVERARDSLLDATWRRENGSAGLHGERSAQLQRLEQALGEPSDTGLLASLEVFWNAWSDLANDPLSSAARAVLHERGLEVADRFHQVSAGLAELTAAGSARLDVLVTRVNDLAAHAADLNVRIIRSEAAGGMASDLRDARDRVLDELSGLVSVQVVERDRGDLAVYISGQALVDGDVVRPIERSGTTAVRFAGREAAITEPGGAIGGLLSVLDTELVGAMDELNAFAKLLVDQVNGLHQQGVNRDGDHGLAFFEGSSASTMGVLIAPDAIAAGRGAVDPDTGELVYRAGHNDIALEIQRLRQDLIDGSAIADRYSSLVARTGAKTASAKTSADVHQVLAQQADIRRESISGVSIDEELALMIRHQAAYGAAARVVGRVDEMLETLLRMV